MSERSETQKKATTIQVILNLPMVKDDGVKKKMIFFKIIMYFLHLGLTKLAKQNNMIFFLSKFFVIMCYCMYS